MYKGILYSFYVALAVLELTMQTRLAWNLRVSPTLLGLKLWVLMPVRILYILKQVN